MKKFRSPTTDSRDSEANGGRHAGTRAVPCAQDEFAYVFKWRSKYGGTDGSPMARMKKLEDESLRLKKTYAEVRLKAEIVHEALTKKWWGCLAATRSPSVELQNAV